MKNTDAVFVRRGMGAKDTGWVDEFLVRIYHRFHRNLDYDDVEHFYCKKLKKKNQKTRENEKKRRNCSRSVLGLVPFFPWASYVALPSGRRAQRQPPALSNPVVIKMVGKLNSLCFIFSIRRRHTWLIRNAEK